MQHSATLKFSFVILCVAVLGTSWAQASPADPYGYDLFDQIGPGITIDGTVITDGNFSTPLTDADIVAYDITVNDGTHSFEFTDSNSSLQITGSDLVGTPTDLEFNFSGSDGGHVDIIADSPALSFFDVFTDLGHGSGLKFDVEGDAPVQQSLSGNVDLGEAPLPGALPLLATGLGALGVLGWRKKRKATA